MNLMQTSTAKTHNWSQDTEYENTRIILSFGLQIATISLSIHLLINFLVCIKSKKYPSQFRPAQGDVIKHLVLFDEESKTQKYLLSHKTKKEKYSKSLLETLQYVLLKLGIISTLPTANLMPEF